MVPPPALSRYQSLLSRMPVIPGIAAQVLFMVGESSEVDFAQLEQKVSLDSGLAARLLKVANSAYYARSGQVTKLSSAIALLGFNTTRNLVLLVIGANLFKKADIEGFFQEFWFHSLKSAFRAADLALATGNSTLADEAFLGGLMVNFGQIPLYLADPTRYREVVLEAHQTGAALACLEDTNFGTNHKELGAALFASWKFPELYGDLAREHGNKDIVSSHKKLIQLVTLAGALTDRELHVDDPNENNEQILGLVGALHWSVAELKAWSSTFERRLSQQPLYQQCKELLGL